ncbi:LacI family DNA-binding transcriptional regulator [Micromonospora zhanjiangensis]
MIQPVPTSPGTGRKRPTIRDVAREAGVSYATVSRVLNGREWVSPEAFRAVRDAIARTGYRANPHARSLATGRSGSIAFLLTEPQHLLFEDPNFSVLLRGVAQALSGRELTLILMIASTPDERDRAVAYLSGGHVDGVLLVSPHSGDPLLAQLVRAEVPIVACGRVLGYEQVISSVAADDRGGARSAVEHLIAAGCRRIATIAGPQDMGAGVGRLIGYREAVRESGQPQVEDLIAYGDFSEESGAAAMRRLLAACPELDAVFVASDLMACGALRVLRERGRRVPEDVAVVGFEDSPIATQADPQLTTVFQPVEEMGRQMARLLVARIRHDDSQPTHVLLNTRVVPRASA